MKTIIILLLFTTNAYGFAPMLVSQMPKEAQDKYITNAIIDVVCKEAGVTFAGRMEHIGIDYVYITEPQTKSTIMIKLADFNEEFIKHAIEAKRKQFSDYKKGNGKPKPQMPIDLKESHRAQVVCEELGLQFVMYYNGKVFFNVPEIPTTLFMNLEGFNERSASLYINEIKLEQHRMYQKAMDNLRKFKIRDFNVEQVKELLGAK